MVKRQVMERACPFGLRGRPHKYAATKEARVAARASVTIRARC